MSGYSGRRGVNVSHYIANLNTIPTAQELAAHNQDGLNIDDDLALFTNTEFFDFDMGGEITDIPPPPVEYDPVQEERSRRQNASSFKQDAAKPMDFLNGEFQFPEYTGFTNVLPDASTAPLPATQANAFSLPNFPSPTTALSPTSSSTGPATGTKRKLDSISEPQGSPSVEELSRLAAEEDKRRRNTAASARFRIKKKQREQALEKTAKEMTEKVTVLESKVAQLEMENKWLKSLITEKNGSKSDITELYRKFTAENAEARSSSERTDGVGTTTSAAAAAAAAAASVDA